MDDSYRRLRRNYDSLMKAYVGICEDEQTCIEFIADVSETLAEIFNKERDYTSMENNKVKLDKILNAMVAISKLSKEPIDWEDVDGTYVTLSRKVAGIMRDYKICNT